MKFTPGKACFALCVELVMAPFVAGVVTPTPALHSQPVALQFAPAVPSAGQVTRPYDIGDAERSLPVSAASIVVTGAATPAP